MLIQGQREFGKSLLNHGHPWENPPQEDPVPQSQRLYRGGRSEAALERGLWALLGSGGLQEVPALAGLL